MRLLLLLSLLCATTWLNYVHALPGDTPIVAYAVRNMTHVAAGNNIRWMRSEVRVPRATTAQQAQQSFVTLQTGLRSSLHLLDTNAHAFACVLKWNSATGAWTIAARYQSATTHDQSKPELVYPGQLIENIVEHESDHHWRISTRVVDTITQQRRRRSVYGVHSTLFVKTSEIVRAPWSMIEYAIAATGTNTTRTAASSNSTILIQNIEYDSMYAPTQWMLFTNGASPDVYFSALNDTTLQLTTSSSSSKSKKTNSH